MAPPSAIEPLVSVEDIHSSQVVTKTNDRLTVDGVPARRAKSGQMNGSVGFHASSTLFRGPQDGKPMAKRWDSMLSIETQSRLPSSLKGAGKYLQRPGMITLGGGIPSSEYFPFERLDIKVPRPGHFSEEETRESGVITSAGKRDIAEGRSLYDINVAFNYGQAAGSAQLLRFVTEHTEIVHNPPYGDWECSLSAGATCALEMAYRIFTQRGEYILTEEYAFSSAMETCRPLGVQAIGIKMDEQGILPAAMDDVLTNWNPQAHHGARKPHLLYTVPTGQNPTSATSGPARRKELYAVCQKHNIYIIEDEPYYFLQMQPYTGPSAPEVPPPANRESFLRSLTPSLLSMDIDGRVMRIDSFSKVVAPGSRVGWITASAQIVERFMRHSEVSVQNPAGISQLVLYKLLEDTWGHATYLDWLMHMRMVYSSRRNVLCNACEKYLPHEVVSWVPAAAGMFQWIKVDWKRHPSAKEKSLREVEEEIFQTCITNSVLISKGTWFRASGDMGTEMFFRTTFAAASPEKITEGMKRVGEALRASFGLEQNGTATNGH